MILDEVIAHEKEVAKEIYVEAMLCHANPDDDELDGYIENGRYHEQVAEWLEELKMYKSLAPRELISEKQKNDRAIEYSKGFDYGFKTGYNNAIHDIVIKIKERVGMDWEWDFMFIEQIAEQLKKEVEE